MKSHEEILAEHTEKMFKKFNGEYVILSLRSKSVWIKRKGSEWRVYVGGLSSYDRPKKFIELIKERGLPIKVVHKLS